MTYLADDGLVTRAVKEFGTPLYLYDSAIMEQQFKRLRKALEPRDHVICFAVKANSNLAILQQFQNWGAGFDIVSGGELSRALKAGAEPSDIVFAGVGKTDDEIRLGIVRGIRAFNIESAQELAVISQIAEEMKATARVSFRINPHILVETHKYLATGIKESKFGIPTEDLISLYETIRGSRFVSVVGVDCHLGSNITDLDAFATACTEVVSHADALTLLGAPIEFVDFGGGMGVSFSGKYTPLDIESYGKILTDAVGNRSYKILVEPGKYLVAEAGALITKVLYTKANDKKKFVIVDAGMNDLIRPALYEAYHYISVIQPKNDEMITVDVAGPVCESACVFAYDRVIPKVERGSLLKICDAGAYGFSMASNYNSRARPAEVLIMGGGELRLIRSRETLEDLMRHEILG